MIVECLAYWGAALWHLEEHPIQAVVVVLCGCFSVVCCTRILHEVWDNGVPAHRANDCSGEGQSVSPVPCIFWTFAWFAIASQRTATGLSRSCLWSFLWSSAVCLLACLIMYGLQGGNIIVLAIPIGINLAIYFVVPPRYWHPLYHRPAPDPTRRRDEVD